MGKLAYVGAFVVLLALSYRFLNKTEVKVKEMKTGLRQDDVKNVLRERVAAGVWMKKVVKVTEGVYSARGYSLASTVMLEGTDGIIIVDTSMTQSDMREIMQEFRNITDKPVTAIILTHFHLDHVGGLKALLDGAKSTIDIYSHSLLPRTSSEALITQSGASPRMMRQFGLILGAKSETKLFDFDMNDLSSVVYPSHLTEDYMNVEVAGIKLQFIHTPGESRDQISVWLPEKKVLLSSDVVYNSFPNISPPRGELARSTNDWINSIDKMRFLRAEHLVAGHMDPLSGVEPVWEKLTNYRDCIQFVHDQTVRLINQGLHVDDIARRVKLPPSLIDLPYLQEHYGTVAWAVRAVYANYTGWFGGRADELNPLSQQERAAKTLEMLEGGRTGLDAMIGSAEDSLRKSRKNFESTGEHMFLEVQWALEITSAAILTSQEGSAQRERAMEAKVHALVMMAQLSDSLNAKNYYLSSAAELDGSAVYPDMSGSKRAAIKELRLDDLMLILSRRLNPDKCDSQQRIVAVFHFADLDRTVAFLLRNCVIEYVTDGARLPVEHDVKLTMTSLVWRQLASKERGGLGAYMSGDLVVDGSAMTFKGLMDMLAD